MGRLHLRDRLDISKIQFVLLVETVIRRVFLAKLQNTGSLIYISLNHKGVCCAILRSSKDFHTCKTGGPRWPCILQFAQSCQRYTSQHFELRTSCIPFSLQPRRTWQWGSLGEGNVCPRSDPLLPVVELHDFQYPYSIPKKHNLKK